MITHKGFQIALASDRGGKAAKAATKRPLFRSGGRAMAATPLKSKSGSGLAMMPPLRKRLQRRYSSLTTDPVAASAMQREHFPR